MNECDRRPQHKCCCNLIYVLLNFVMVIAMITAGYFILRPNVSAMTLELTDSRGLPVYDEETIMWNSVASQVGENISYDGETGEITFNKDGYYYLTYYFNIIPNTVNSDISFVTAYGEDVVATAAGSGSNSGSPSSYCNTQIVIKAKAGESVIIKYVSDNHEGVLLADTEIQGNVTITYLGSN